MYTSTPLLFLPFSLQHFFLLPSNFSPRFAPLFPLIILQMFHPLSFDHPQLSLSPHASVTFISIFCLFPPSPSSSVASFFLSSLLFPSSFSPRFPSYHPPDVPSSFLLSSSPLSFPPCFRHFYLLLLPLPPLLHPPPLLLFVSLLPPLSFKLLPPFSLPFPLLSSSRCSILFPSIILTSLFPPMLPSLLSPSSASFPPSPSSSVASLCFSPPSPSSLEILQPCPLTVFHPLSPPFLLSSNLCTLFSHFSPSLFSVHSHISCSLSAMPSSTASDCSLYQEYDNYMVASLETTSNYSENLVFV